MKLNQEKMFRILEQARAARMARSDLSTRLRAAREKETHIKSTLDHGAHAGRAMPEEVAKILAMPFDEGMRQEPAHLKELRIDPDLYRELLRVRQERARLLIQADAAQDRSDALNAPIDGLQEWLKNHGLRDYTEDFR